MEEAEAARALAEGRPVVLVIGPGAERGPSLRNRAAGRLALMVGDPGDPEVMEAAAAMDAELFGARLATN